MPAPYIAILAVQGAIFLLWAFLMFRALFRLWGMAERERDRRGLGYFGGIGMTFEMFAAFAAAPEHRKERNRIIFVTLVLFATIGAQMAYISTLPKG